jgi:CHAT domain
MGPIPSGNGIRRYFLDLYVPSYTPTISALIESRKSSRQSSENPSLLLVVQPDGSLQNAWPEIGSYNVSIRRWRLLCRRGRRSLRYVVEGPRDLRFAHFVSYGKLESSRPFDASFQLYAGKRLTLLEIVRSRVPSAEFAFLSACHTDEALHLTAAVQYCGFRSVVGTMWVMVDMDGQRLVEDFYMSTFSSEESRVQYYERTAMALRDAVKKLRKKGVPLGRWVSFVHYGA